MLHVANLRNPILINSIGHTAGVLLFGLILVLLIRDRRGYGIRQTRLSIVAAALAFAWNVGSLVTLAWHGNPVFIEFVLTLSFSLLSLLPAVLLHVALDGKHRWIVAAGYLVSASAILLHFSHFLSRRFELHETAVTAIAFGFGILTAIALWKARSSGNKKVTGIPEWISLTCLLLFTSSFLHFGRQHVSPPWASEITWHHVGIPVALIVLLQDYRFLLLDTFTRFLVNFGLASLYIAGLLLVNERFALWEAIQRSDVLIGISLVMVCVSLILFAYVRNALQRWTSRVIFRRDAIELCGKAIMNSAAKARSEEELLAQASQEVARHLRTDNFAVRDEPAETRLIETPFILFREHESRGEVQEEFPVQAQIPLRFSSGDSRLLIFGPRRGGRRYLSEDLEVMRNLGAVIAEQVERFRTEELKRLADQAELRALQAQINPHFLFNALNTLYGTIDRRSHDARRTVLNLADILRYVLHSDRAVIELSEEVRIIQAYLEIESLRLGERLQTELDIRESARSTMIPILSIQPLIENAVKHGISNKSGGGKVCLTAEKSTEGLLVSVEDTGIGFERSKALRAEGMSVGLENVRRRLIMCHGPEADLHIVSNDQGTRVTFFLRDAVSTSQPVTAPVSVAT